VLGDELAQPLALAAPPVIVRDRACEVCVRKCCAVQASAYVQAVEILEQSILRAGSDAETFRRRVLC
jgi:hypothetical protein